MTAAIMQQSQQQTKLCRQLWKQLLKVGLNQIQKVEICSVTFFLLQA